MLHKGLLQGRGAVLRHSLQRDDGLPVRLDGQNKAAADGLAVQQHGAGPAIAAAASFFRGLDAQPAAQHVQQRFIGRHSHAAGFAVQPDRDFLHGDSSSRILMP